MFLKSFLAVCSLFILFFGIGNTGVLMQGFYWDVPKGGGWYNTLYSEAKELKDVGFTAIWFPSPLKGMGGGYSMGYDAFDHYDLGEYEQKGTVETRFGNIKELKNAVKRYRSLGMDVYVDTVMNHMGGGDLEENPETGTETWTKFIYPHGKFEKNWEHFVNNDSDDCYKDPGFCGTWGPELCNENRYVSKELKKWGKWLSSEIGFNGYRIDAAACIGPDFLSSWITETGNKFTVGEYWDANRNTLAHWVNAVGNKASAFDFSLFYTLKEMCNDTSGNFDMKRLYHAGLVGINPMKAVTFVENHDTDKQDPIVSDKMLAYAYTLTGEGYPTVFWKDYYNYNLKSKIAPLVWIHENLAGGSTTVIHNDNDLYVAKRNSQPGLIVMINDSPNEKRNAGDLKTPWRNKTLKDYTGNVKDRPTTDNNGYCMDYQLWAPPRSYTVWAPE